MLNSTNTAQRCNVPDSKVHGVNMGLTLGQQDPGGPHVDPMNFAIWGGTQSRICMCWVMYQTYQLQRQLGIERVNIGTAVFAHLVEKFTEFIMSSMIDVDIIVEIVPGD